MSTAALAPQPVVIADRLVSRSLATDITLVLTGAVVVGGLAQVGFGYPVPWTGQTLGVLLVGGSLGRIVTYRYTMYHVLLLRIVS